MRRLDGAAVPIVGDEMEEGPVLWNRHRPPHPLHAGWPLLIVLLGCSAQSASAPATLGEENAPLAPGEGLSGRVTVQGGAHDGEYTLAAERSGVVCIVGQEQWTVGFASQELTDSVTTLQLAGTSRDRGAPLADFFMTIGATTELNTVRIAPSQAEGAGETVIDVQGELARVQMTGTTGDGVAVSLVLGCSPVDVRP